MKASGSVCGRRSGLMVSAFVPRASGPDLRPGQGHCVVFLGKTLNFHSTSLQNCWGNITNCGDVTCDGLVSRLGGVEILLAASCYGNWDKLQQL